MAENSSLEVSLFSLLPAGSESRSSNQCFQDTQRPLNDPLVDESRLPDLTGNLDLYRVCRFARRLADLCSSRSPHGAQIPCLGRFVGKRQPLPHPTLVMRWRPGTRKSGAKLFPPQAEMFRHMALPALSATRILCTDERAPASRSFGTLSEGR